MFDKKRLSAAAIAATLFAGLASAAPFGETEDIAYATRLWAALKDLNLVGADMIMSVPYTGQHPHGAILDTVEGPVRVLDNTGVAIVKRNYGGDGVSKARVYDDPANYLAAITVMYKRKGYDSDNQDWFWAKYKPDGSLDTNPKGIPLAGRVAKGMPAGCIACHTGAPGGDLVFNHDRY